MNYIIKEATTRWRDIPKNAPNRPNSGAKYEDYMIENYGYSIMRLKGGIGHGSKVHIFRVLGKIENNTIFVADCMSFCGSAKFTSSLYLSMNQNLVCNCKRCKS